MKPMRVLGAGGVLLRFFVDVDVDTICGRAEIDFCFDVFAEEVNDYAVSFLDVCGYVGVDDDLDICESFHLAATFSE